MFADEAPVRGRVEYSPLSGENSTRLDGYGQAQESAVSQPFASAAWAAAPPLRRGVAGKRQSEAHPLGLPAGQLVDVTPGKGASPAVSSTRSSGSGSG
jgi:hypothetical protein